MRKSNLPGKVFLFSIVLFLSSLQVHAADRYSVATGNWNATTTWSAASGGGSGASVPGAGDIVHIERGYTVTITAAAACASITIYSGSTLVSGTFIFTITGTWVKNGTFTPGGGTVNFNSVNAQINAGTGAANFNIITIGLSTDNAVPTTLTINTTVTCTALTLNQEVGTTVNTLTISGTNQLTVSGAVTLTTPVEDAHVCTLNVGAGTLGCGSVSLGGGANAKKCNLSISTGTVNVSGNITFTNTGSNITFTDAGKLNIAGTFVGATGTLTPSTGTVNFNGTAAQTIPIGVSAVIYHHLTFNNTNASGATLSAAVTATNVTGNISVGDVSSGSLLNSGNFAVTFGASKTLTVAANSTLNAGTSVISFGATGTAAINGTFKTANTIGFSGSATTAINSTNTPTINLGASSTIEYNAAGNQAVTARTYNNLALSGSGNKTILTATTINKNLSISGTAKGLLNNGGTSTAETLTLGGVNQLAGTWSSNGYTGTSNKNDTWFVAANTGIINVTGGCTVGSWSGNISTDWATASNWCSSTIPTSTIDVTIPSGTPFQPTIGAAAVCKNITINSGATLTFSGSNTLTVHGNWSNSGTLTAGTGTVAFNNSPAAAQTITGTTGFNNLTINNTAGVTLGSELITVNGILNLLSANASATQGTLHTGTYTLNMGASATTDGTGDVTGIVRRTSFALVTPYSFGNKYTTLNITSGTLPTEVSYNIVLSATHTWKTNAINRYYDISQTGGNSTTKV
ncbi:MAG: hypothetical protein NTV01_21530, partial [Bacteroidia bacterium]|nr:hypothetical protein [Bacteroidia bacterium]